MPDRCPECGAPVPEAGSCRDHFHALLLLEVEIPGVPGTVLHTYAVGAYALQHPDSMGYTAEALAGLRRTLADLLEGRASPEQTRRRTRLAVDGPTRVLRRAGEPAPAWRRGSWPLTIADVCTADTFGAYDTAEAFADHVVRWARSVVAALDAANA